MYQTLSIFGSYNRQSIGDKAILVSLIHLLLSEAKFDLALKVFTFDVGAISKELSFYNWSNSVQVLSVYSQLVEQVSASPEQVKLASSNKSGRETHFRPMSLLPQFARTGISMLRFALNVRRDVVDNSDGLIIGGGNLLMDLYPHWPIRPYMIMQQYRRVNLPVVIAGVGAFPIKTRLGKLLLKKVVQEADGVFVRDNESQAYISEKWHVSVQSHPDFALSFPLYEDDSFSYNRESSVVSVNIAPIFGQNWPYQDAQLYQSFIKNIANALWAYYQNLNRDVLFSFYDTNYPTDRLGAIDVITALREKGVPDSCIEYEDTLLSSCEVVRKLGQSKFALTTRLHAGLLALRVGVPVLALAYQPKVEGVLNSLGLSKCVLKIQGIESSLSQYIKMIDSNPESFKLSLDEMKTLDFRNRQVIREILETIYHKDI